MMFASTRGKAPEVSVSEAILRGLAPDGGLYVPRQLPVLAARALGETGSYAELAFEMLAPFFAEDVLEEFLPNLCLEAFNFPITLHWYSSREAVLELFHGPTAAFKDFGARFLAVAMEQLLKIKKQKLTILVATSGDTGGAVAAAFHGREGISVKVLFPKGRVSQRQEKQLTCWGDNVQAYAVEGDFDDCQRMVKASFMDRHLCEEHGLTSANSINLGRLLPQMVYAFYAALMIQKETGRGMTAIIPSGNAGNCCGSYWARAMGAPIDRIVLAVNANRTIVDYLEQGFYRGRPGMQTIANAMDVGDPSNMERLFHLFVDHETFSSHVSAYSVDDNLIRTTIGRVWRQHGYIVCPHTATGEHVREILHLDDPTVVYATAHPAKFDTVVQSVINAGVAVPPQLAELLDRPGSCTVIPADYRLLFA